VIEFAAKRSPARRAARECFGRIAFVRSAQTRMAEAIVPPDMTDPKRIAAFHRVAQRVSACPDVRATGASVGSDDRSDHVQAANS
jgi:hypothetical protein